MRNEDGHENTLSIHVTLLPYISTSGELKKKPTQHSVREMRSIGIQPDVIVCRSDRPVADELRDKISLFCDVPARAVIPLLTMPTIYDVPLVLEQAGLGNFIVDKMGLPSGPGDLVDWQEWVERLRSPGSQLEIALVGKYVELPDAYLSVRESLIHAGVEHQAGIKMRWLQSDDMESLDVEEVLGAVDGIVVPGGFGERGFEGKIRAARYARENNVPYLGLCLGLQVMVVEFARHMFGTEEANSTEFLPESPYPVISLLSEQRGVQDKGGTMRLGGYPCRLMENTKARAAYGCDEVTERHRHRYELNNEFRARFEEAGLTASGTLPDDSLVEICELKDHPWMVGSQFHPEFRSRPNRPHPLFVGFVGAALERAQARRLPRGRPSHAVSGTSRRTARSSTARA